MNVLDTIDLKKSSFTKSEQKVYELLNQNYNLVFSNSINSLAEKLNVSQASISRFCKKLGYDNFNDFRYALYDSVRAPKDEYSLSNKADCMKRIVDLISSQAESGEYDHFIELLVHSKFTVTSGAHRSALPARLLMMELMMLNKFAKFQPTDEWANVVSTSEDYLVVCFSERSAHFKYAIENIVSIPEELRPKTVLICTDSKHPLRRYFDEVIVIPSSTNQNMPERVEPVLVYSIFLDIVVSMLADKLRSKENRV